MLKTAQVYDAVVNVLIAVDEAWTVAQLTGFLVQHVFGIDVAEHHVRRAVALLPAKCVVDGADVATYRARNFALPDELLPVLIAADNGHRLPLLLTDECRLALRRALVLVDDWALDQSLNWAHDGGFVEYAESYYAGMEVTVKMERGELPC